MKQPEISIELKLGICLMFICAFTLWAFYGSTENSFVWDTTTYLNKHVHQFSIIDFESLSWMASTLDVYNWHPFTWLSWAIDYQIYGGLSPWGYHFSSNLLHAINACVLFFLILMVFGFVFSAGQKFTIPLDNKSLISALLASLLFAIHPQHVESVAWVAERKDLLCQFFLMLTMISYMKYAVSDRSTSKKWYFLALTLYFCAVMSKPMAVTLPVLLLLIDIYPIGRSSLNPSSIKAVTRRSTVWLLLEKLPFLLLSLILVVVTLLAQQHAVNSLSLGSRVVNAANSVILYLEKFVFPVSLNPHYPYFLIDDFSSALVACLMIGLILGITIAAYLAWKKQSPAWLTSWLFYLIALSPVLGLIQVGAQGAADRYSYFPTLPFYLLIAGALFVTFGSKKTLRIYLSCIVVISIIAVFTLQTRKQISVWENELSLWSHVVELDPSNKYAHNNLGMGYKNIGDYESAIIHFEAGGQTSGADSVYSWRATTYMHLDRFQEAIENLVKLGGYAESNPELIVDESCIYFDIGWSYAHLEMYSEAQELFERVESNSYLKPYAVVWADYLNAVVNDGAVKKLPSSLPELCENLVPSQALTTAVRN